MVSRHNKNRLSLAVGTALAAGLLVGCAGPGMAVRSNSADGARTALANGKVRDAVAKAEAAVAATPNDASLRILLGDAYFKDGRFASAATTYDDAQKLGDKSPRTALNLALSRIGAGDQPGALAVLESWRESIPASDLGLALSLAGEPDRGVAVLADALRGGENTVKVRQNLAYSYALSGRWREARIMASQDLPADQLDKRISDWAETIQPEQYQQRVATLLRTPLRSDPGQPSALALNDSGAAEQASADAVQTRVVPVVPSVEKVAVNSELPAVTATATATATAPAAAPAAADEAPAAAQQPPAFQPAGVAASAPVEPAPSLSPVRAAFLSHPVMHTAVTAHTVSVPAKSAQATGAGSHLVQLGAFSTAQNARRAWGVFTAHNPALAAYRMDIREAVVNGKHVWRVAAAGLGGAQAAFGLCSKVRNTGGECFAYSIKTQQRGLMPSPMQHGMAGPQMARRR